jgi:hypothetical protein
MHEGAGGAREEPVRRRDVVVAEFKKGKLSGVLIGRKEVRCVKSMTYEIQNDLATAVDFQHVFAHRVGKVMVTLTFEAESLRFRCLR